VLYSVPDSALLSEVFRGYNDWLAEFCSAERLKGIAMINVDDVQEGIKELGRERLSPAVYMTLTSSTIRARNPRPYGGVRSDMLRSISRSGSNSTTRIGPAPRRRPSVSRITTRRRDPTRLYSLKYLGRPG
jgi:hypothetical protein